MISRALLLLSFLSIFLFSAQSQPLPSDMELQWGEKFKLKKSFVPMNFRLNPDGGFFVIMEKGMVGLAGPSIQILEFDKDLVKQRDFDFMDYLDDKEMDLEQMVEMGGLPTFIMTYDDVDNQSMNLYRQSFNTSTFNMEGEPKLISKVSYKAKHDYYDAIYNISKSPDGLKTGILYDLPVKKNEKQDFYFVLLDEFGNIQDEYKIMIPFERDNYFVLSFAIDNFGTPFLLSEITVDKESKSKKGNDSYDYMLTSYEAKGTTIRKVIASLKDKHINELSFGITKNNEILAAGFYGNTNYSTSGVYSLKLDMPNEQILSSKYREFDFSFIKSSLSEGQQKKATKKKKKGKKIELANYGMRDLIINPDGSSVLSAEYYNLDIHHYTTTTYQAGGGSSTSGHTDYLYTYGPVIIVKLDPTGEIEWIDKTLKNQFLRTRIGPSYIGSGIQNSVLSIIPLSFNLINRGQGVDILFNDHPENFMPDHSKLKKPKRTTDFKKSLLVMDRFGNDKKPNRISLGNFKSQKVFLNPNYSLQVAPNQVILFGSYKKNYLFGRLEYKE
jgi:dsDNA-binding SOS-regulon protein